MYLYHKIRNYFQDGGTLDTLTSPEPKHNNLARNRNNGDDWSKRKNTTKVSPNGRRTPLNIDDIR